MKQNNYYMNMLEINAYCKYKKNPKKPNRNLGKLL